MEPEHEQVTYTFEPENPIVRLSDDTLKFFMEFIQKINEPEHQLFLFKVYVRLHGSNKFTNTKTNSVTIISDTIVDKFQEYLAYHSKRFEDKPFSIFVSFYYVLKAIVSNNCIWILSLASHLLKPMEEPRANIMRVHTNKETNEITYTKPDCLK
jgi:hypothetical protein